MLRSVVVLAGAWLSVLTPAALGAQDLPVSPPVRAIHIIGARERAPQAIQEALRIKVGQPLADTPMKGLGMKQAITSNSRATWAQIWR